jgi:RNA recognition motif-containing protein
VKNIFVGNLDSGTTAASVRVVFEPHGTIQNLKLMIDRETGLSRGFAFVEMIDAEADSAIAALDGSLLDGRTVDVHEGRPRLHLVAAPAERRVPRP